jgi:hypothetical protein
MSNLIVIGLSHAFMLKSAYANMGEVPLQGKCQFPLVGPKDIPSLLLGNDGDFELPKEVIEVLQVMDDTAYLAISINNNVHNVIGLFFKGKGFHAPNPLGNMIGNEVSEFIPSAIIADIFEARLYSLRLFVRLLKSHISSNKLLVLEGVTPAGDPTYIENFLIERGFTTLDIVDRATHKTLFDWQGKTMQDICREEQVEYVGCPENVTDHKGFLIEKYWQNASHANMHYGRLLLQKMFKHIEILEGEIENV